MTSNDTAKQRLLAEGTEKADQLLKFIASNEVDMFSDIFECFNDGSLPKFNDRANMAKVAAGGALAEITTKINELFPYERPLTGEELHEARLQARRNGYRFTPPTPALKTLPYMDNEMIVRHLMSVLRDTEKRINRFITAWNTQISLSATAKTQAEYDSYSAYLNVDQLKKEIAANCFIGISGEQLDTYINRIIQKSIRE